MRLFQVPGRRFYAVLLASSALSLVLAGCIETPKSYDPNTIATADPASGPHIGHDMGDMGGNDTTGSVGSNPPATTNQNPVDTFLTGQWLTASQQDGLAFPQPTTDSVIPSSELIIDKNGTQILSWKLSSNLNPQTQAYTTNTVSVNVKKPGTTTWLAKTPFDISENSNIADLQIKTDLSSGATYALWQKLNGDVFISSLVNDATSSALWSSPEQIINPGSKNILMINSHGMPIIFGINNIAGGFEFVYKNKMHTGVWATDVKLTRLIQGATLTLSEYAFAIGFEDSPTIVWNEASSAGAGWQIHSAQLDTTNIFVDSTVTLTGLDLSKLKSIHLVTSSRDKGLEAIFVMDTGEVSSVSYMSMDNGASYMWHTPLVLVDSTTASAFTLAPVVMASNQYASILWGEYMMPSMAASTTTPPVDTTTTATDGHAHVHKSASRAMVMANTNMLKMRNFKMGSNWNSAQIIGSASGSNLIKYVTPELNADGQQSVAWIESDNVKKQIFAAHNVATGWKKELVSQVDNQSMTVEVPLLAIDATGKVNALWVQEMAVQTGGVNISFVSSQMNTAVHPAHVDTVAGGNDMGGMPTDGTTGTGGTTTTTPGNNGSGSTSGSGNTAVSATWGASQTVWTGSSLPGKFNGPDVKLDNTGHAMIYMNKISEFVPELNAFGDEEYLFYRHVEGSIWNLQKPQAPVNAPNAKLIRYSVIKSTGEVYALWSDNLNLYFSRYIPTVNQWLPAEALNVNAIMPYLLVDETGMATLIWTSFDNANNTTLINARHFMPETGWTAVQNTSVALAATVLEPVLSSSGVVTMSWLTRATDHANPTVLSVHADLWTAEFDPNSGWSTHIQGVHVPEFAYTVSRIHNINSTMKLATFYNFLNKSLTASLYMNSTGWSEIVNLYQNGSAGHFVMSDPIVRANINGDAIVAWKELVLDDAGNTQEHYVSSSYSMNGGWKAPVIVAHEAKNNSELNLVLDNSGNAIATWISTDSTKSMVHVNHYDPAINWGTTPEMLAGYDRPSEWAIHPKIDINFAGQAIITWDHVMIMNGNEMHNIQAVKNF